MTNIPINLKAESKCGRSLAEYVSFTGIRRKCWRSSESEAGRGQFSLRLMTFFTKILFTFYLKEFWAIFIFISKGGPSFSK